MKDKNLPNDYNSLSLEELTIEANKMIEELESQSIFSDKIVTEVNDIQKFFIAEDYHHDYFTKNPENAYCQAVINPKLIKLWTKFSDLISE